MAAIGENLDVIIVGAGAAGLKAALELKAKGKSVLILEARDRIGGRAMPGQVAGHTVDFGGQWVGAQQNLLRTEALQVGVPLYAQYTKGESLISIGDKVTAYSSSVPKLSWLALLESARIGMIWDKDVKELPADAPWKAEKAIEWDAVSLEAWLRQSIWTGEALNLLRTIATAILCADPVQVSYLYFLEVLRQGQGLETMLAVEGGSQQDKLLGGAWLVFKRMADLLEGDILLSAPVRAIKQDEKGVTIVTDQAAYTGKRVIVTAPPQVAAQIEYAPALPVQKIGLLRRMPMGAVIKMHIAYPTPFWRKRGLTGAVLSPDRKLSMVFDQSPSDESIGILVGLIEGHHALEMSPLGREGRQKEVLKDLIHYFGNDAAAPLEYVDQDWIADEWAQGGYGAHMPPGVMTSYGAALREPVGKIHWAGTETATEWLGYFEGALQSGIRVAKEVIQADQIGG